MGDGRDGTVVCAGTEEIGLEFGRCAGECDGASCGREGDEGEGECRGGRGTGQDQRDWCLARFLLSLFLGLLKVLELTETLHPAHRRIDPAAISPNRKALLARPNATQADLAPVLISLTDYMHEFNKDTEFEVYGSCAFTYTPKHAPTSAVTLLITTKKGVAYQFTVTATRYRRQGTQHVADARVALDGGARDAARKLCRWRGHRRAVHWRRGDWRVAVRPRGI
ncbi:hypothetical protein AMAG_10113 [Allomyces macrogynus ATCC 38327]|uniref:Uncharacterized protein n=1 Tax=Allomyces macrogynus (strain ATCC 38327) TaxID=578462 RepID=A0A0L0SQE5_ALLM3|nr:hypothetical protein AMAG_10113 [Allomyces macrogynus ATCC 38327]|eukprot:KNE64768.1 hypothetical protein AMAG_10113 [Allomyces macrogynus ATCC 38327]